MLQATYTEELECAYCNVKIEPGKNCYLAEVPGEVIACCRTHAIYLETEYKLGKA